MMKTFVLQGNGCLRRSFCEEDFSREWDLSDDEMTTFNSSKVFAQLSGKEVTNLEWALCVYLHFSMTHAWFHVREVGYANILRRVQWLATVSMATIMQLLM